MTSRQTLLCITQCLSAVQIVSDPPCAIHRLILTNVHTTLTIETAAYSKRYTPAAPFLVSLSRIFNFSDLLPSLPLLFLSAFSPPLPSFSRKTSVSTALPLLTAQACSRALYSHARNLASSHKQKKLCAKPAFC
jgi:hypothetical protein